MDDEKQPPFTVPSTTTRPDRKAHEQCTGGNFLTSVFGACFGTHWFTNGNAKKIGAANVLYTEKNGARVIGLISILYSDTQEMADKPQTSEPNQGGGRTWSQPCRAREDVAILTRI